MQPRYATDSCFTYDCCCGCNSCAWPLLNAEPSASANVKSTVGGGNGGGDA